MVPHIDNAYPPPSATNLSRRLPLAFGILLFLLTWALYWPALDHEFVDFDDAAYIFGNDTIKRGLSFDGLYWAFFQLGSSDTYWHPVTWISHMIDVDLFGLNPAGHHLVSILWHSVNALLLYALILRLKQPFWAAAFVSALFAWHPLQVDTVAWAAERKSLLAMFFWLLATWTYIRYTESRTPGRLALSIWFCALGLLCKPVLVTFPCTLLLLDVWPLRRIEICRRSPCLGLSKVRFIVAEKLPFFALSVASSVITLIGHQRIGALTKLEESPLSRRVGLAFEAYLAYISKLVLPHDLAVYHPFKSSPDLVFAAAGVLVVLGVSAGLMRNFFRVPSAVIGWFWFLGVLFPMIGVVHAGPQFIGERFVYIPSIGFFAVFAGCGAAAAGCWPALRLWLITAGGVALMGCLVTSSRQLAVWQNTVTLFTHSVAITGPNPLALSVLAAGQLEVGRDEEAMESARQSISLNPTAFNANEIMGNILLKRGAFAESLPYYEAALRVYPKKPKTLSNYGTALAGLKRYDAAVQALSAAVEAEPRSAANRYNLALVHDARNDPASALTLLRDSLRLDPSLASARRQLGLLLIRRGEPKAGEAEFREGLRLAPDSVELLESLAYLLSTHPEQSVRNGTAAVSFAREALRLSAGASPRSMNVLAAALAERGDYSEAIDVQKASISLLGTNAPHLILEELRKNLRLYESRQPLRIDPTPAPSPSAAGPAR
jgi:tetratricopeptide (TPR) repeat protein